MNESTPDNLLDQKDTKGRLKQTPPRMRDIRSQQRSFGRNFMPNIIDASFADQKLFDYFMVDNEQNANNNKHKNKTHVLVSRQSPQRRCKKQKTSTPLPQQQTKVEVGIPTPSPEQINSCSSHNINANAYPLLSRFATVLAEDREGDRTR